MVTGFFFRGAAARVSVPSQRDDPTPTATFRAALSSVRSCPRIGSPPIASSTRCACCLLGLTLALAAKVPAAAAGPPAHRTVASAAELRALFVSEHFSLARVRRTRVVPPVLLMAIPPHLHKLEVRDYEHLFIAIMLPSIVLANSEIAADRARLHELTSSIPGDAGSWAARLAPGDTRWVRALATHYAADLDDGLADLHARVDTIPTSLALAQAIDESGWGSSRFAIEANSLFGEHQPSHSGAPGIGARGAKVEMEAFESVHAAATAYLHNLNTTAAYAELRTHRAKLRAAGNRPGGLELAPALASYSARGTAYVDTLVSIMRHHKLDDFDTVALDPERRPLRVFVAPRAKASGSAAD